jgi:hypothetical protein
MQWRKDRVFNKYSWEKWIYTYTKLKLDPCTSTNSIM